MSDASGSRPFLLVIAGFGLLLLAGLFIADRAAPGGRGIIKIGGVDPVAYYGVAHSLLYDRDVDLENQYQALQPLDSVWLAPDPKTGRRGSSFPIGYSLLAMPALAAADGVGRLAGERPTGFERRSKVFFFVANVLFVSVGLALTFQLVASVLVWLGAVSPIVEWSALAATLAVWLGTTLGYYTLSPMAHAATFMVTALFFLLWWRVRESERVLPWVGVGLIFGVMVMCRWQTLLYAIVPLGYEIVRSRARDGTWTRARWTARVAGALAALVAFGPQMVQWKVLYGSYLTIPQGPGFIELPPAFATQVLFSSRHGWFVWTPVALLGCLGLLLAAFRPPAEASRLPPSALFGPALVAILAQVAMVGSLPDSWHNHTAFGIRMLTSAGPLLALGLASLALGSRRRRLVVATSVAVASIFTLLFAVQFRVGLLPRADRLTFQELVIDKVRLSRALERRGAVTRARRLGERGDPEAAIGVLEASRAALGDSRASLELLSDLYRTVGRVEEARNAQAELGALLDRRLY